MGRLRVEVIRALPDRHECTAVELEAGARVRDALSVAGLAPGEAVGIFGRRVALDAPLADGDRVEIYRALAVDPKETRRRRARAR